VPGQHGFPRTARLTRKTEYDTVFQSGAKTVAKYFVCHVVRREGQGRKLGIAVSRKVGPAVVRNRIKRYLREHFRTHQQLVLDDTQVVIVARPAAKTLDFHACSGAIRDLLARGGATRG